MFVWLMIRISVLADVPTRGAAGGGTGAGGGGGGTGGLLDMGFLSSQGLVEIGGAGRSGALPELFAGPLAIFVG